MDFWTPVGVIFAGLSVAAPFLVNIRRPVRRRVEYVISRNQPLLNVPGGVSVDISVDGKPVRQAFVTVLRFANSGTEDFPVSAWEGPLSIRLPGSSIISAQQIAARPKGWRIGVPAVSGDTVELAPQLLNAGDLFELQIVSDGAVPNPQANARIVGVKEISRRRPVYNLGNGVDGALELGNHVVHAVMAIMWLGLIAMVILSPIETRTGDPLPFYPDRLLWIAILVGVFGIVVAWMRWATVRNQRWRPAERF